MKLRCLSTRRCPLQSGLVLVGMILGWSGSIAVAQVREDLGELPQASESRTLAIVTDGESWYFDRLIRSVKAELGDFADGEYGLTYIDDLSAGDEDGQVKPLLRQAVQNPNVDVVYAAGLIATWAAEALEEAQRGKPIVGGALQLSDARGRPISDSGTSTLKNYSFISSPQRVGADLELLQRLSNQSTLHVILNGRLMELIDQDTTGKREFESRLGVTLNFVPAGRLASETLQRLPASAKAAYVTVLSRMTNGERRKLYQGLAQRGVPSVAMLGEEDVELGAMASLAPSNTQAVARRVALNIHQLFLGASTEALPVYLPVQDRLIINQSTAQATGWSPDYDTALEAEFVNLSDNGAKRLSLLEAVQRAGEQNVEVLIAREEQLISREDTLSTRSNLFPQIDVVGSHGRTGTTDKINPATPDYVHQGSYGLQLRQLLFSDEVFSSIRALRETEVARFYELESQRYDAIEEVALAYFDLLTAQTLRDIERENLRLTQNNLQLAQLRLDIGAAESSEVFRWEQNRASSKASLIQSEADAKNAQIDLSRILRLPLEQEWLPVDMTVGDHEFQFMDEYTSAIMTNNDFQKFGRFVQRLAVENSPELYTFDHLLAGQGILLGQRRRTFFLPEISATAGVNRLVAGQTNRSTDGQNEGILGIQFSYPLGQGGFRQAEIRRQEAVIRQLAAQRERAVQQIEQRALAAFNGIGATHPNIRLSRAALDAAMKNYEAVEERYSQGAATILDLLDAQTSMLQRKQQYAVAAYGYLKQIYSLQRSIAWFEFQKDNAEKQEWGTLFNAFLRNGVLPEPIDNSLRREAAEVIQEAAPSEPGPATSDGRLPPPEEPKKKRKWFQWFKKS